MGSGVSTVSSIGSTVDVVADATDARSGDAWSSQDGQVLPEAFLQRLLKLQTTGYIRFVI